MEQEASRTRGYLRIAPRRKWIIILDTRVCSVDEIARALYLPLLGRIAPPESFRVLRTNVDFANVTRNARLIMDTSAGEESKSTTAANLAFAFARQGKRVALAELDVRRPLFGSRGTRRGSRNADVAVRWSPLDEANGHGAVAAKLDMLIAGSLPPNPGEFVGTRGVKDVLCELRVRYDLVLIDSAPLLHVGDD